MRLNEIHELAVDMAKEVKEQTVRRDGGKSDIHPQIICFRGEEPVAMIFLKDHVREEILRTFWMCAMGFAADSISTLFETYIAAYDHDNVEAGKRGLNPRTGRPWGEGGMQLEAEHFQGIEKGLVSEALAVTTVNRAGDATFSTIRFHYVRNQLVWEKRAMMTSDNSGGNDGKVSGHMIEQMVKAMNMPAIEAVERELALCTTIHERDVWTTQFLMGNFECAVVLVSDDNPERVSTISKAGDPL